MNVAPAPGSAGRLVRLAATILVATVGGVGMWSVVVALPVVQAEFAVPRAEASLAFTLTMVGGATGGVILGRLLDRAGILPVLLVGATLLAVGYVGAAYAGSFAAYAIAHGVIGFGSSIALGPLMADISHWFVRRRGVAVTLTSAGNYVAGTVWSPVVQHLIASIGWRSTRARIGIARGIAMQLIWFSALRGRAPRSAATSLQAPWVFPFSRCKCFFAWPRFVAVSRCRCRKSTSSLTAAISA